MDFSTSVFPFCKQKLHIIKNTMPQRAKKVGGGREGKEENEN